MRAKAILPLTLAALAVVPTASAHVTVEPTEAPSDSYATLTFGVPHGCDGSPTTRLRVQVPRSVASVTPQVNPGWIITTKEGPKDPVELHGERVDRGISEVIYTAKQPLADGRLDQLGMSVKLPPGAAGEAIPFPALQTCAEGETAWIQVPAEGESPEDLEEPAPALTLTAGEDGAGPGAEASDDGDDGPSTGLVIAALALGGAGLLTGIAALLTARRRTA